MITLSQQVQISTEFSIKMQSKTWTTSSQNSIRTDVMTFWSFCCCYLCLKRKRFFNSTGYLLDLIIAEFPDAFINRNEIKSDGNNGSDGNAEAPSDSHLAQGSLNCQSQEGFIQGAQKSIFTGSHHQARLPHPSLMSGPPQLVPDKDCN